MAIDDEGSARVEPSDTDEALDEPRIVGEPVPAPWSFDTTIDGYHFHVSGAGLQMRVK